MNHESEGTLGRWDATVEEIAQAMGRGIERALAEHRRIGNSVVIWDREAERIEIIPADQIEPAPAARPGATAHRRDR